MILAIDVGTTFLKVAVLDFNGNIEFFEKRAVKISRNDQFHPDLWLLGLKSIISTIHRKLLDKLSVISVSGMGPTVIPVTEDGSAKPALLWTERSSETIEEEMYNILGYRVPPNFYLAKIYSYMRENGEEYNGIKHFLSCPEFISYSLTNRSYTVLPGDGFKTFYWSEDELGILGLDKSKFPEFITPYTVYGHIESTEYIPGVKKDLPVICGGPDFLMALLGTGSVEEGILCDRTGTSEGLNYCSSKEQSIEGFRTLPHIKKGLFTISGLIPQSGEFVLNGQLDSLVERYRLIVQKMIDSGLHPKEIRIIGGHAGIDELNRLKASLFDIPLKVYPDGSDLIGNGILAAVVVGVYKSIDEACGKMVRVKLCLNI